MDAEKYHKSAVTAEEIHSTTEPYTSITARLDKTKQNNTTHNHSVDCSSCSSNLQKKTIHTFTLLSYDQLISFFVALYILENLQTQKLRNSETQRLMRLQK